MELPASLQESTSVKESDINGKAVGMLKETLEKHGYKVINAKRGSLTKRVKEKKDVKPDYYVSLHANSGKPSANGEEVLYRDNNDKAFATAIHNALANDNAIPTTRSMKKGRWRVLGQDPVNTRSTLVELGFITNTSDRTILTDEEKLKKQVLAIANGITKYHENL